MPVVRMPDGQLVELPDNPTPQEMGLINKMYASGTVKEVGRVADKVVRKGALALPGIMGELGAYGLGKAQETPIGLGLPSLGATILRAAGLNRDNNVFEQLKFGDVTKTLETAGGLLPPVSEPQTSTGKAVANTFEPAVATMLGGGTGSMLNKGIIGASSGAGGEVAARYFGDNFLSRFLGSVAGGGLAGVVQAHVPNSQKIIKEATEHMRDSDWNKADKLKKVLDAQGIPHLNSQLMGPRSTLDDVVAVAGTNPRVRPKLTTAVDPAKVSERTRQSMETFSDRNLKINIDERRDILSDVQKAAAQALQNLKDKANRAYTANMPPQGEQYDVEHVKALRTQLLDMAKGDDFGKGTKGHDFLRSVANRLVLREADDAAAAGLKPGSTMDELDALLEESVKSGKLQTSKHVINNLIKDLNQIAEQEGYKGLALERAKGLMKGFTPEFGSARAAKTAVSNAEVNPAGKGLTGDLARMGGGVQMDKTTAKESALKIVFPDNTPQPRAIMDLEKTMGGDSVGQLLREHLAQKMEAAAKRDGSGGGPAGFVASIANTNAQRQNINAALEVTARSNGLNPKEVSEVRKGFYKLLKAFDTFRDLKLPDSIDRAALQQESGKNMLSHIIAPASRLGRSIWERTTAKTFNEIADTVLAKDGLQKLRAIAQAKDPELVRQTALGILTTTLQSPEAQNPGIMPE